MSAAPWWDSLAQLRSLNDWLAAILAGIGLLGAVVVVSHFVIGRRIGTLQNVADAKKDAAVAAATRALQPRTLTPRQQDLFVQPLRAIEPAQIEINYEANDRDAEALCRQVVAILDAAGWTTQLNTHLGTVFAPGIVVHVKDAENPTSPANALLKGLSDAGLQPKGVADNRLGKTVHLVVGPEM